jgi:hypothetical protein
MILLWNFISCVLTACDLFLPPFCEVQRHCSDDSFGITGPCLTSSASHTSSLSSTSCMTVTPLLRRRSFLSSARSFPRPQWRHRTIIFLPAQTQYLAPSLVFLGIASDCDSTASCLVPRRDDVCLQSRARLSIRLSVCFCRSEFSCSRHGFRKHRPERYCFLLVVSYRMAVRVFLLDRGRVSSGTSLPSTKLAMSSFLAVQTSQNHNYTGVKWKKWDMNGLRRQARSWLGSETLIR